MSATTQMPINSKPCSTKEVTKAQLEGMTAKQMRKHHIDEHMHRIKEKIYRSITFETSYTLTWRDESVTKAIVKKLTEQGYECIELQRNQLEISWGYE